MSRLEELVDEAGGGPVVADCLDAVLAVVVEFLADEAIGGGDGMGGCIRGEGAAFAVCGRLFKRGDGECGTCTAGRECTEDESVLCKAGGAMSVGLGMSGGEDVLSVSGPAKFSDLTVSWVSSVSSWSWSSASSLVAMTSTMSEEGGRGWLLSNISGASLHCSWPSSGSGVGWSLSDGSAASRDSVDIVRVVLVDEGEDEHVLAAVVGGEREQRLDGVTAHYPHSPTLFGQSPTSIQPCAEDQSFLSFSLLRGNSRATSPPRLFQEQPLLSISGLFTRYYTSSYHIRRQSSKKQQQLRQLQHTLRVYHPPETHTTNARTLLAPYSPHLAWPRSTTSGNTGEDPITPPSSVLARHPARMLNLVALSLRGLLLSLCDPSFLKVDVSSTVIHQSSSASCYGREGQLVLTRRSRWSSLHLQ